MFHLLVIEQLVSFTRASIASFLDWLDGVFDGRGPRNEQGNSTKPIGLDDEWVNPWIRQQRLLKEALARAKQENSPTGKSGLQRRTEKPASRNMH